MALLTSEIQRLRFELGYNALTVGAEPYIGVSAIFEQVIATYLSAGATTTSSTSVVSPAGAATTLTLASATGFAEMATVVIDVDAQQERVTVRALSGSTITVFLSKNHTGTYPVTVEGGESMVRDLLTQLRDIGDRLVTGAGSAGIKQVDEIEFFKGARLSELRDEQGRLRDELAGILGVENLWRRRSGAGQRMVLM